MSSWVGIAAASWGVVMGAAPALQIRKMIRAGGAEEVSPSYFGLLIVGFVLWIAYGISLGDWALIVPNTVALTTAVGALAVALYFRRRHRPDDSRPA
ncbi:SemiSWEET family transporter [Longispora sp. NPDC051575]|uniref:SemiSWEET family sugar transporter n=1 Tax=Longispora sp. NPDC051575 TaxID=3154943 RepID=UPI0034168AC7